MHSELSMLTRSFVRLSSPLLMPDLLKLGLSMFIRSCSRLELCSLFFRLACIELMASVLDFVHLDAALSMQSVARLDAPIPIPDSLHSDSPLFPRFLARSGLSFSPFGLSRSESSTSVPEHVHIESLLPTRLFTQSI